MPVEALCPKCRKPTNLSPSNRYRPFCSERCSILDLGAWASEEYKVPVSVQETESVNKNAESDPESLTKSSPDDESDQNF